MSIGAQLKNIFITEERERLGLKAKEIAEFAGVTTSTQSNYENGKRHPDTQYLKKLAELGFDLNFVVTGKRQVYNASAREAMLLELFRASSESVQNHILAGMLNTENTTSEVKSISVGNYNQGNIAGNNLTNHE